MKEYTSPLKIHNSGTKPVSLKLHNLVLIDRKFLSKLRIFKLKKLIPLLRHFYLQNAELVFLQRSFPDNN